jgi:hypothetical protein
MRFRIANGPIPGSGETGFRHVPGAASLQRPRIEVPPQFIALCDASSVSPHATLRGIAAMLCGLRYDDNRLLPLDASASR